ncbi:MAG: TIGR02530 family flagellar biosynthesis protein [Bdellovibrionota bacterium]
MSSGPFLYPNVTSLPGQSSVTETDRQPKKPEGVKGEFDHVFEKALGKDAGAVDLNQVRNPLKFSAHASQRLKDRKIALDSQTLKRVNDAVDRAEAKGVEDTLVLTKDAALIVSVKNRTVITAMDREALAGNIFTNIDGAVIV